MENNTSLAARLKELIALQEGQEPDKDQTLFALLDMPKEEFRENEAYAKQLCKEKRWRDASDVFFFLAFLDPKAAGCWYNYGKVELDHGSAEAALGAFQTVILLEPIKQNSYLKAVESCLKLHEPMIGLYYLELFKAMFSRVEVEQNQHQIKFLEQQCQNELEAYPND